MCDLARWSALCRRAGATSGVEEAYETLVTHYQEPHRAYHNLAHIAHCLAEFDAANGIEDPIAVELALWFHDVIYNTHCADNEQQSADFAMRMLVAMGIGGDLPGTVASLILCTRHQEPPATPDGRIIVDIDLAILAAPPERFDAYEAQIRQEYAWVSEDLFREKRQEFLQSLLAREWIFSTPAFRERYESKARENLRRSIARLSG